jgi:hypothetical protein
MAYVRKELRLGSIELLLLLVQSRQLFVGFAKRLVCRGQFLGSQEHFFLKMHGADLDSFICW